MVPTFVDALVIRNSRIEVALNEVARRLSRGVHLAPVHHPTVSHHGALTTLHSSPEHTRHRHRMIERTWGVGSYHLSDGCVDHALVAKEPLGRLLRPLLLCLGVDWLRIGDVPSVSARGNIVWKDDFQVSDKLEACVRGGFSRNNETASAPTRKMPRLSNARARRGQGKGGRNAKSIVS